MNPPSRTALCGLLVLSFSSCVISFAQSLPVSLITNDDSNEHPLYLKVRLSDGIKISKLRPSDATEGVFSRSVYSGERELFPAGSHVRLIVSRLERRRRARNDHWPWVIQLFTPRHEQYPTFEFGNVLLPSSADVPLKVAALSMARSKKIQAGAESPRRDKTSGLTVAMEATESSPEPDLARTFVKMPITLAAGTQAKIVLLGDLSASKSRPADTFQARLVEPVRVGSSC
jgi:hypothetical protein